MTWNSPEEYICLATPHHMPDQRLGLGKPGAGGSKQILQTFPGDSNRDLRPSYKLGSTFLSTHATTAPNVFVKFLLWRCLQKAV